MTYFGPVQWYQKLHRHQTVFIEQHDSYVKQTYRNRCIIATANGQQALTVPVERTANISDTAVADTSDATTDTCASCNDIRISDHGNWRHLHWNALESAYNHTPFFEYYKDDFRPFYEQKYEFLADFNETLCRLVCSLIGLEPQMERTTDYKTTFAPCEDDFRERIHPKKDFRTEDPDFCPQPYYQVFQERLGFLPNLSIVDLLFNMGPESLLVLQASHRRVNVHSFI